VVLNSGLLVFREGLEAILVVAAITASFLGANAARRRPVGLGVGMGLAASVVTWFCAVWIIGALGGPGLDVQAATVLEGVGIGLAFTAAVGVLTFVAHHKLPYKRMLVLTGAMIGFVLVVMVGESAQELQLAGWIPTTQLGFTLPGWLGTWLAIFPTVETLAAQALAAAAVIGSYLVAEHVRARRPAKRGLAPGQRPELPPREVPVT
jgi:high-affinity Fe2+/Pb2+ permease